MNTLTNSQIKCMAEGSKQYTHDDVTVIARGLLAAEVEVTSLKRERETMHSIEYVQGVLARTAELEAQLEALRGKEPEQIRWRWKAMTYPSGITTHPMAWTNVEKQDFDKIADIIKHEEVEHQELFIRPVPPAASQPLPCPFPCGWEKFSSLAIQEGAFIARGLVEGEEVTPALRQAAINNTDRLLKLIGHCRNASQPYTVPDETDPRDAFEKVFPIPKHAERCGKGYCCTAYNAWDAQAFENKWEGWNACRAAMLQSQPVSKPDTLPVSGVTAEHQRVIEMLLKVCGAAFELADDACECELDGEQCITATSDSFAKLSDALDEIENTLPTEDADRPDVFLAWAAMPRAALKSILQSGNSPVIQDGWVKGKFAYDTLFNAIGKAVTIQGEALSISVKAFEDSMISAAPQHKESA